MTGRIVDRRGRIAPLRVALVLSPVAAVVLPLLDQPLLVGIWAVIGIGVWDIFWPPAMALLADGAEEARIEQTFAFALQSMAWGPGAFIGSVGGGILAEVAGDVAAWSAIAAVCVLSLPLAQTSRLSTSASVSARRTNAASEPSTSTVPGGGVR